MWVNGVSLVGKAIPSLCFMLGANIGDELGVEWRFFFGPEQPVAAEHPHNPFRTTQPSQSN